MMLIIFYIWLVKVSKFLVVPVIAFVSIVKHRSSTVNLKSWVLETIMIHHNPVKSLLTKPNYPIENPTSVVNVLNIIYIHFSF